MQIEIFLYIYGAICASMIGFNIAYALLLRGSELRLRRRTVRLKRGILRQTERLARGEALGKRAFGRLRRKLRRVRNLIALDRALSALPSQDAPLLGQYMGRMQPTLLYLARVYRRREPIQAAYFAFFTARWVRAGQGEGQALEALEQALLGYMAMENLYCRVNALQALCAFAGPRSIVSALKVQDRGSVFFHEKILTETLLAYQGDARQLIAALWEELSAFGQRTQLAILNYIRFCSGDYCQKMFDLMEDEGADKELRLAAIRYLGRYPYSPARGALLAMAAEKNPARWEYTTVSVAALARYQGQRVVDVLKGAMHSPNWYVRYAAAASLESQQVDYEDLIDLTMGSDRYAREMIMYRLETRRLDREGR